MANDTKKGELVLLIGKAPIWILGNSLDDETIESHLRFDEPLYVGTKKIPRISTLDGSEHKMRGDGPSWIPIYGKEEITSYLSGLGLDCYLKFIE